jgi:iron complex outermembrane receptor protein
LGIAYTYGQDLDRAQPLPEIAPLDVRYTLYGNYWSSKVQPELSIRYVADQSRISPEFGETRTPSFVLLDLKLAFQVTKGFSFDLGVQNLLDELYYEHLNRSVRGSGNPIFAPGRNILMHVNYTF